MQALILAAGMGKRLGRYTKDATKCMVSVNGMTLIERTARALAQNGITRLVLVVGYRGDVLRQFVTERIQRDVPGLEVEFIENSVYDKTNNIYSLYLAREQLARDDTLLLESDIIFRPDVIQRLIAEPSPNVAVVSPFEPWMDGTCTLLGKDNCITAVLDKAHFDWNDTRGYYKTVNIYKLSAAFSRQYYVPFLEAYQKAFGKNEYYEEVLKVLSYLSATMLKALPVDGGDWYEIDDPADLAIAENRFADSATKLALLQKRYGGYWRFPGMLDFCYLVNPYFPPKRLLDELKASFGTLATQYPSGADQQSLLAGKMFGIDPERIAVGNGAAELIASYGQSLAGTVAVPYPTFNEYPARFTGATVVPIPVQADFSYSAKDILGTVDTHGAQTVLLINPDNPSGAFLRQDEVLWLLEQLSQRGTTLVFDESFIDFAERPLRYTLMDEQTLERFPNLVVIKSISKSYGVPGLRLGVLASADKALIGRIKKRNAIWNINSAGEYFLQIYDKYAKTYATACDSIAAERTRLCGHLRSIADGPRALLTVFPSQANYVLCRIEGTMTAQELCQGLLDRHGIFIKDLSGKQGFAGGQYIRLAVRDTADNDRLLAALRQTLR